MAELLDEALLLRRIPYGDTSLICHFLTREHGRMALMARGARRTKSPLRAALTPLYPLMIRWRSGRTGMGTLIDVERGVPLLPESSMLAGLELLAVAAGLFHEGDLPGYEETLAGVALLATRPDDSGLCVAAWHLLQQCGWAGGFDHCWQCDAPSNERSMYWQRDRLLCGTCGRGMALPSGFCESLEAQLHQPEHRLTADEVALWQRMIGLVLRGHGVKMPAFFNAQE